MSFFSRVATLCAVGSVAAVLGSCGAKTGLLLPDVMQRPEACVPGRFNLDRRSADVLFLIDRSNSMALDLEGRQMSFPTRWQVLTEVLGASLPAFESALDMGAAFYPRPPVAGAGDDQACQASASVDVEPGAGRAAAILSILQNTGPAGGTPTYEGLRVALASLTARQSRARARYIVLATDGGPNCNESLDPFTCVCTSQNSSGQPNCAEIEQVFPHRGEWNCLDDTRTLTAIGEALRQGIPTYVIGIDDPNRPDLTDVLNRMAIAGGRPNTSGRERYYSVRRRDQLVTAFDTIQRTLARCAFVTPSRPDDPDAIDIEANGTPIPRDTERGNGWDWTDPSFGEITLFGEACERFGASGSITARVGCRDR